MGYSIRTTSLRYTQWRKWLPISEVADWSHAGLIATELYDHRENELGADPSSFENENLSGNKDWHTSEMALKHQLERIAKSSDFSNKRCGQEDKDLGEEKPTFLTMNQCSQAYNQSDCEALYLYECAWFPSYGCKPSQFCGFHRLGATEEDVDCLSFSTRCSWQARSDTASERCVSRSATFWRQ